MRVTLPPAERAIVRATLAIANCKQIPTLFDLKRLVEPHLKTFVEIQSWFTMRVIDPGTGTVLKLTDWRKNLPSGFVKHNQVLLQKWLGQIAQQGRAASSQVAPEVEPFLGHGATLVPSLRQGRVTYSLAVDVIPGLLAYGTALILDRDRGLTQRLGQCGYCGRFNLAFEGRPRTHCNEAHRLAYDRKMAAARMRTWRKRQRKQREEMRP